METGNKYDFTIDMASDTSHSMILRQVPKGSRVLEFGCATGYMSRFMRESLDCAVVGVELDPAAAAQARPYCERVLVGDLDSMDLGADLGDDQFDVIIFADVLEHLKDPWQMVANVKRFLAPNGRLLASLPNFAHGDVRLSLLFGKFEYRPLGLLDNTHIRFFTVETLQALFETAGYEIVSLERTTAELFSTELQVSSEAVPPFILEFIRHLPEVTTYQFVAHLASKSVGSAESDFAHSLLKENARLRNYQAHLEAAQHAQANQDRLRYQEFERVMQALSDWQSQAQLETKHLQSEIGRLAAEIADLRQSLAEAGQAKATIDQRLTHLESVLARIKAVWPLRAARGLRRLLGAK